MLRGGMTLAILLLGILSFGTSVGLTACMKRWAVRVGFVDRPGHRKIHHVPKPLGGGVAIFLAVVLPMLAGVGAVHFVDMGRNGGEGGGLVGALSVHQGGIRQQTPLALKFVLAIGLMHVLGLWDDRKALGPYVKLLGQFGIVLMLVIWADLRSLTALDGWLGLGKWPSVGITAMWIVAITNAFNFLDNMDGLSAGVGAVCAAAFLGAAMSIEQWFVAACLALLLGALLGFLCFNFSPASIFMGDSGSLIVGLILGVLTVRTTYLRPGQTLGAGWYSLLSPLIVLAVPLYDLLVVSAIRLMHGKSPFVGDTNHFSHRLVARGMSRRTAVLCLYLVTAATSVAAVLLAHVESGWAAVLIFVQTLLILGVVMLLEQHPLPKGETGSSSGGDEL